jgi:DNA primase
MDALLVNGIATSGNTPSDVQCDIIDDLKKEVILVPDADKAGGDLVKTAIHRGWNVSFPPWEDCKDAADAVEKYGRLFTVKSILDSVETNSTKIQLLARSYCKD